MSDVNRRLLAAAATAIATAGTLTVLSTPAQAEPPCQEWEFPGGFALNQNDGFTIEIPTSGANAGPGNATYFKQGIEPSIGPASGGINGRQIEINVPWSNGSTGTFRGFINPNGSASGSSQSSGGFQGSWTANKPMICADAVSTPEAVDPNPVPPPVPEDPPEDPAKPVEQKPPADQPFCFIDPFDLNRNGACP
jgi:hypothetical protein